MRSRFRLRLWGLMAIVASAAVLLMVARASLPGWAHRDKSWQLSRPVHAQLDRAIP